ncbi:MAG: hypothetical protein ACRDTJ_12260, partial [Pseudonocardiaceae bacterium]
EDLARANDLLAAPRDIDLSASQRLGLHVVARLAARHRIRATITTTPGSGITAVVALPAELFADDRLELAGAGNGNPVHATPTRPAPPTPTIPQPRSPARTGQSRPGQNWTGWWTPTRLPTVEASSWPASAAPASVAQQTAPTVVQAAGDPPLKRRVPQANLTPELRRPSPASTTTITGTPANPDAKRARDALSRYQTSRLAAQQKLDADVGSRS